MKFLTWDQAQFSFCFVNNIPAGKAKRKESLIQAFTKCLPPTFLIDWHLLNQPTKIASVACFFSMLIIHTWKNCRLADLKNHLYLLIFSTKNKTVSTNHIQLWKDGDTMLPTFLIDWHLLNQPTKIASVACFFSMLIIHTWKNCRLADLKNHLYLLIFSTKNKTVSTNHI